MQQHWLQLGTVLRDIPRRKEDAMKRTGVILAVIFALVLQL
jgi:hypothetical protein